MTDLATLGIQIDSRSVPEAVGELDKLTAAGARAEGAVGNLESGTKSASRTASDYAAKIQTMAKNTTLTGSSVTSLGTASVLAQTRMNKLTTEVGSLTGQLATGSIGAQGLASSLGRISVNAVLLLPALAGLAVTAGLVGLAFLGIKQSTATDAEMKKYAANLGLTKKEMDKLKDVTVTWGDVGKATFDVLAERAGTSSAEIKKWFTDAFHSVGEFGKFSVAVIVAAFVSGYKMVGNVWSKLPSLIGEAAVGAANVAIMAIEKLINFGITGINGLTAMVNDSLLGKGIELVFGTKLPQLASASLGRVKNEFAGTGKAIAGQLSADFFDTFHAVEDTFDSISERSTKNAEDRLRAQADDIIDDRTGKKPKNAKKEREKKEALSEAEKAYRAAMNAAQDYLNALSAETDQLGLNAVQQKQLDVAVAASNARRAAAVAPTLAQRDALLAEAAAIEKAGATWVRVYNSNQAAEFIKNRVEPLEFENTLLGKNAEQQEMLRAERELTEAGIDRGSEAWTRYLAAVEEATAAEAAIKGQQQLLDTLTAIADQAVTTGQIMADAFGGVGDVIGGLIGNLADYQAAKQALTIDVLKGNKTQQQADIALHTLQMRNTAQAISGVKSLFKEKSTAFKVISAVEKAYAAWQAAETIASMVRDATKTASSVANSAVRTSANTAEGGSKIFAELGPWAFPVVAAMVAVLAALGASGLGGGGGSSGPSIPTADDLQASAGTGTVLGDSKAKSDSIARSLEIVADNTNSDLQYSNAMLKALRSIDTSIAKMAGTVARQISVSGGMFDTAGLGLGSSGSSGFLGLFGSSTTKSLFDLGINLASGTVADIIANGIGGETYKVVEKIKKKSGFLGIGGGTKTSYKTTTGAIDPEITDAIQSVIRSLRDGLVAAADVIGLDGAQAILDSFNVSLGKISFKDMTGEQIEDQLNAIFSSIGDQMAGKLLPSLKSMQLVGEGLFETFIRVAKEYEAVDIALKSIGRSFGAVGVESVGARDALVQLFGGLDEFLSQTDAFRDQFFTDAQKVAPIQASVIAEMQRLGLASITTRDQFRDVVLGLDLTTDAGRQMYASLLAVAPAFDTVLDYFDDINKKAADALKSTVDQFSKFADSLTKYRDTLFATDMAQGNAYSTLKAKFVATAALAATGDATALGGLEGAGKDFLTSARNSASSLQQYQRDVALVAQGVDRGIFAAEETADYAQLQLDALTNATSILQQIADNTAPVPIVGGGAPAPAPSNDELVAQNETIIQQNATIVSLLTAQGRIWSRFDGDGLLVRTDSDTPLNVVNA